MELEKETHLREPQKTCCRACLENAESWPPLDVRARFRELSRYEETHRSVLRHAEHLVLQECPRSRRSRRDAALRRAKTREDLGAHFQVFLRSLAQLRAGRSRAPGALCEAGALQRVVVDLRFRAFARRIARLMLEAKLSSRGPKREARKALLRDRQDACFALVAAIVAFALTAPPLATLGPLSLGPQVRFDELQALHHAFEGQVLRERFGQCLRTQLSVLCRPC